MLVISIGYMILLILYLSSLLVVSEASGGEQPLFQAENETAAGLAVQEPPGNCLAIKGDQGSLEEAEVWQPKLSDFSGTTGWWAVRFQIDFDGDGTPDDLVLHRGQAGRSTTERVLVLRTGNAIADPIDWGKVYVDTSVSFDELTAQPNSVRYDLDAGSLGITDDRLQFWVIRKEGEAMLMVSSTITPHLSVSGRVVTAENGQLKVICGHEIWTEE